ncbi:MAG: lipid-A-disaccharide synthase [Bacteroidales bacterium]|nr:lipid-A-disaccharide synthase [Bacteroidales bacterium]
MKYYLIAGEASGDLHGANLMRALQALDPEAQFRFWGGDAMSAIGGQPVRHIRDLAIMGFIEVAAHLSTVLGNISFCKHDIAEYKPDVVIGIDYPGFNLKIEEWAHLNGYSTAHYISPNLWAWKKSRIKKMRRSLDTLCYILPFEQQFFASNNMPQAVYVGHPLLDEVELYHRNDIAIDSKPIIALLPGSRRQELIHSLPAMTKLAVEHPEYHFVVAGMSIIGANFYNMLIPADSNISVLYDQTYNILAQAYAAVVCSGTATLETALFNVPQVVCYRANPVSIAIARAIVSRRIRYISLVNLIADAPVVTELIQEDFNQDRLENEFNRMLDSAVRTQIQQSYATLRTLLGGPGASERAARQILNIACKHHQ